MHARMIFDQRNGDVTKAYYAEMGAKGFNGLLAVALFRAQKRSTAAKRYSRRFRSDTYDVKNWSIEQACSVLLSHNFGFAWGWARDLSTPGFTWVLYVDLPTGQCSFHARQRGNGPDYAGKWRPGAGSESNILEFCESMWDAAYTPRLESERLSISPRAVFPRTAATIADGLNEAIDNLF
jgi:hypothetical protein